MLTALFSTLILIAFFCGTTFAWFTSSTATDNNKIATGNFKLDVTVVDSSLEIVYTSGTVRNTNAVKRFTLKANDTYTVTLKPTAETTVSRGYAHVTIGTVEHVTETIYTDSEAPFSFTLTVSEDTTVTVRSSWGIPALPTIENNSELTDNGTAP